MWNAASTSAPRAAYSVVVAVFALFALVLAASGGATPTPKAPNDLTLTGSGPYSLSLSWAAAQPRGGRSIVGYHVYLDGTETQPDLVPGTSFDFGSLHCGTTYTLGVDAVDDTGAKSDIASVTADTSPCATDTSNPTPPTGLEQMDATKTSVTIAWTASRDDTGVVGYSLSADGNDAGTTTVTTKTIDGLSCGRRISITVSAYDGAGNRSPSASITGTTAQCPAEAETDTTPPTPPGNLALVSRSKSEITVSWSASTDDVGVAGYELLLDGVETGTTTSLSASFSEMACGQSYRVGVRAFDSAGNRSQLATLATATLACTPSIDPSGVNWFPGYYALAHSSRDKLKMLDDPLVAPFTGVQFRYFWAESELAPADYSAGFAALDTDLRAVAAKSKKLLVMLQYKKGDGTPAVPADLLVGSGPWCRGRYCGELAVGDSRLAMVWNAAVNARLKAWISAMAAHAAASPYASSVAGIVFNETSLGTTDTTILREAGYDPYVYMGGLQENMLAATGAAPRFPVFYYHEGGFVSMDGRSVHAGRVMGDWMLQHPHTGAGTPDLKPKDPKTTIHPCANPTYQGRVPCNPDVQAPDYALKVTDSLDQSYRYAVSAAPDGLLASYFTFAYAVGSGPNAFTFADVSRYIPTHPIPNTALPPGW